MTNHKIEFLSKREKSFQFFYLILLFILITTIFSCLVLRDFTSPFSNQSALEMQMLEQKKVFIKQQIIIEPKLESTFNKISILKFESPQPFVENDIITDINGIANSFNSSKEFDSRKEAYVQIGYFFKMFFEDKKIAAKKTENIKLFKKQFEECSIGFKDKEEQFAQKKNAIESR